MILQKVVQSWSYVFNREKIDPDSSFSELGGHSKEADALYAVLKEAFPNNAVITSTIAYDYPSINKMVEFIKEQEQNPLSKITKQVFAEEPIAVVGLSCRFPGHANSLASYWELLSQGRDAIAEVPATRFDINQYYDPNRDAPGKMVTKWGGFLDNIEDFDPSFFNLSQKETLSLDPQHRLVLEETWRALECAGISPPELKNSLTGIFLGSISTLHEYEDLLHTDPARFPNIYTIIGSTLSAFASRVAYILGLQGPTLSLDAACAASLVAIHEACEHLKGHSCNLAIAGGVALNLGPEIPSALSHAGMLSPHGQCKTFDESADGYVRGEGIGILILKRLSDAKRDKDIIWALIKGGAVNQNGPASGITVPNGVAQQKVLKQALANAGASPKEIDYIEAHGTGTKLGDPIEANALSAVYKGSFDSQRPLLIGSVKTNIGHLEPAAGVAGIIKVILALKHSLIPPHLHLKTLNHRINLNDIPAKITTEATPWKKSSKPRLAGVSSFGFTGTNAHIIIEEAPALPEPQVSSFERPLHLLVLSAKTEKALDEQIQNYLPLLKTENDLTLGDIAYTAAIGRAHFAYRAAVIAKDKLEVIKKLEANDFFRHKMPHTPAKIAFLFTGQGSQYSKMGYALYENHPVFQATMDKCFEYYLKNFHYDLKAIWLSEDEALLQRTEHTQPLLFILEYALFNLWKSFGISPAAVCGHSLGEYVAALAAEIFSLSDALTLIYHRSHLMQSLPPSGAMLAVSANRQTVESILANSKLNLSLAAINAPQQLVLSGKKAEITQIETILKEKSIQFRRLNVSHAFHSSLMEPVLAQFREIADKIIYKTPTCPFISNVTGNALSLINADYWVKHMRQTVNFMANIQALAALECTIYLEIGPHPILLPLGQASLTQSALWLPSLLHHHAAWETLLASLAQLYLQGAEIHWKGYDNPYPRQKVLLPTYPFQRERFWVTRKEKSILSSGVGLDHPLVHSKLNTPITEAIFLATLDLQKQPYLKDHKVYGHIIFPAAGFMELLLAVMANKKQALHLSNIVVDCALELHEGKPTALQLIISDEETPRITIYSERKDHTWQKHVSAQIKQATPFEEVIDLSAYQLKAKPISLSSFYQQLAEKNINCGPSFQGLKKAYSANNAILAYVEISDDTRQYIAQPALLDACLQTASLLLADRLPSVMPVGIGAITLKAALGKSVWVLINKDTCSVKEKSATLSFLLLNESGHAIGRIQDLQVKAVTKAQLESVLGLKQDIRNWFYEWQWEIYRSVNYCGARSPLKTIDLTRLHPSLVANHDDGLRNIVNQLGLPYVIEAFLALDLKKSPTGLTLEEIMAQGEIKNTHQRLIQHLLNSLVEANYLSQTQHRWHLENLRPIEKTSIHELKKIYPELNIEIGLLERSSKNLKDVWQGRIEPLDLLFKEENGISATTLYHSSPTYALGNQQLTNMFAEIINQWPNDRRLRILEVGAGTGGTSQHLLPLCDSNNTDYIYTDITASFFDKAKEDFKNFSFVQYHTLDLEKDPESQGFSLQQYDMIVAGNVLHATLNIETTLAHIRALLVPGGLLLLLEGITKFLFADLTFGLLEGWWRFNDKIRNNYPLLSEEQWTNAFQASGFIQNRLIKNNNKPASIFQSVLCAQLSSDSPISVNKSLTHTKNWLILGENIPLLPELTKSLSERNKTLISLNLSQSKEINKKVANNEIEQIIYFPTYSPANDDNALPQQFEKNCLSLLHLMQNLKRPLPNLLIITTDVFSEHISIQALTQSGLWGMARSIQSEYPEITLRLLDLDSKSNTFNQSQQIMACIQSKTEETQFRIKNAKWTVGRLIRKPFDFTKTAEKLLIKANATYVIAGGLSGLGYEVCQKLIKEGAHSLALLSRRSQPSPEIAHQFKEWEQAGIHIKSYAVDIGDYSQLTQVLKKITRELAPIKGIIHSAGVLNDALIENQTAEKYHQVLNAKVRGAWYLHLLTQKMDLDHFVVFSSVAALLGPAGQSNHAAANNFLDVLIHFRRQQGLPGLSINWGAWSETGSALKVFERKHALFIEPITTAAGLTALTTLMFAKEQPIHLAAFPASWEKYKKQNIKIPPFLSKILAETKISAPQKGGDLKEKLSQLPETGRLELMQEILGQTLAQVLQIDNYKTINIEKEFSELGMDSLMSLDFRNRLQKILGDKVIFDAQTIFNYPNLAALNRYLLSQLAQKTEAPTSTEAKNIELKESATLRKPIPIKKDEKTSFAKRIFNYFKNKFFQKYSSTSGRVVIKGIENIPTQGPLLIAINHAFLLDRLKAYPVLDEYFRHIDPLPSLFVTKKLKIFDFFISPLYSPIYVSRSNYKENTLSLEVAINDFKNKKICVISPEGRQNRGALLAAKLGMAFMAVQAKVNILPVAIYKDQGILWIKIAELVKPDDFTMEPTSLNALTDKVMYKIAKSLPKKQRGVYQ